MSHVHTVSQPDRQAFLKSVNHDLNNQFTVLRTNLQLALRDPALTEETRLMLEDAMCAADRIMMQVKLNASPYATPHVQRQTLYLSR